MLDLQFRYNGNTRREMKVFDSYPEFPSLHNPLNSFWGDCTEDLKGSMADVASAFVHDVTNGREEPQLQGDLDKLFHECDALEHCCTHHFTENMEETCKLLLDAAEAVRNKTIKAMGYPHVNSAGTRLFFFHHNMDIISGYTNPDGDDEAESDHDSRVDYDSDVSFDFPGYWPMVDPEDDDTDDVNAAWGGAGVPKIASG